LSRCGGKQEVRDTINAAAAPFRQPDGSDGFQNKFKYLIALA
jgi:hypothetical protein